MSKLGLIILITVAAFSYVHVGAKECDSELDGHLIKVSDKQKLNSELVFGTYLKDESKKWKASIKPMVNFANEYNFNQNTFFYFNGGLKYRASKEETNSESNQGTKRGKGWGGNKFRVGLRSLYIQNQQQDNHIRLGFMEYTMHEHLLLDERGAGVNYFNKINNHLQATIFGASLLKPMSRESHSCVSKTTFIKREFNDSEKASTFSDYFGGFNLAITLFTPNNTFVSQTNEIKKNDDEFEEISSTISNTRPFALNLMYYVESYNNFRYKKHFIDLHNAYSIFGLDYALEWATQFYKNDLTLGYINKLSKTFLPTWTGPIKIFSGYTAYNHLKGDEAFTPHNSNMFLSDRMQYLTYDNKILFYGMNFIPKDDLVYEIASYHQLSGISMELDNNLTWHYTKTSKVKFGHNLVERSSPATGFYQQIYVELRHIF